MKYYPWQMALSRKLGHMRSRLPHSLLLQGRGGIGKLDFAMAYAQSLLCEQPQADCVACGACQSCNWFSQNNHPDFRLLEPEEESVSDGSAAAPSKASKKLQISVDQVRELADFLTLSSHRAGLRIILLHPAEALNPSSANALLKMLEEPPPGVLFLLVTHQPQRLLPTIRSRCSKLAMPIPSHAEAEQWLQRQGVGNAAERLAYCGGAPLQALAMEDGSAKQQKELHALLEQGLGMDPYAATALCMRESLLQAVEMLQKWIYDLLSLRLTGTARYHPLLAAPLQALAERVDLPQLLDFQRVLNEARRLAQHPLNMELQTESLMFQYTQIFSKTSRP
jgi:DNA polymerase-3 subunit delta'